ncbi:MAG: FCD domain-containing protein [Spirochaetaceae bacterium]|jgi:DNA-binding FadR family transcriptional regulator|nr:FCD domain-containing protein [Spirochaetaceae bacterium]
MERLLLEDLLQQRTPAILLTSQITGQICQLINERHLAVGGKLPSENELARLFCVGRGTVREAVKLLISRNILEIRRGKGTFVCENPGIVEDPFGFRYRQDKIKLISDLIGIRSILEPEIAALAAARATEAEAARMRQLAGRVLAQAEANEDFSAGDISLHTLIAKSSRNMVMPNLIPVIHYGIEFYNRKLEKHKTLEALALHSVIISAIEKHDGEAARRAMDEHLSFNRDNIKRLAAEGRTEYTDLSPQQDF